MDELPYAIMCELRAIAGASLSTSFRPIGNSRPSPEVMNRRRPYQRPLMPQSLSREVQSKPESKFEYSASLQDLVDFGLIKHGFWHDGSRQTTQYGFHLTEKAVDMLKARSVSPSEEKKD